MPTRNALREKDRDRRLVDVFELVGKARRACDRFSMALSQ
jgi:hypothetical protein